MDQISGLSQICLDFSKMMSGILDPRILTFWNSGHWGERKIETKLEFEILLNLIIIDIDHFITLGFQGPPGAKA
jgi:hypothetical protein